jgi:RNA polymerase sigma-70 factor (ECF subfamily)|tara:strand:- start:954 stop:1538 length:585 start_codon:yes stop_codon:yes gene_type:complete
MKKSIISDSILVSNYISGDEKSLEILIKRHKQRIYSFIYSKVYNRDLTEDIFQDTFIKVIKTLKLGNYNEEGKFISWVMRIAHNLVIDHFRKNKRIPKFENSYDFDIFSVLKNSDIDIENQMIKDQIHSEVKKIIDFLPDDQKEVLVYRYYNDLSFKEISEKTGVSINTSLGRMRYALINLRNIIKNKNISLTN